MGKEMNSVVCIAGKGNLQFVSSCYIQQPSMKETYHMYMDIYFMMPLPFPG